MSFNVETWSRYHVGAVADYECRVLK